MWHGYSWFKGPYEILAGDVWIKRKQRSNGPGRCPGIDIESWQRMREEKQLKEWMLYRERFGEPPPIPSPEEIKARRRKVNKDFPQLRNGNPKEPPPCIPAGGGGTSQVLY